MQVQHQGAALSLVFFWVLVFAIGYAHAGQATVFSTGTFSGSFVNTQSDTNGDGIKGSIFTGAGEDSVSGKFTTQSVTEHFASGETTCPNGNPGFVLTLVPGTGAFVNRIDGGELMYGQYTAETQCFDPFTMTLFYSYTIQFTGGTGRFVGATGTSEGQGTATILFQDVANNMFGAGSGQYTTTLILLTAD